MLRVLTRTKLSFTTVLCSVFSLVGSFAANAHVNLDNKNFVDMLKDQTALQSDAKDLESTADELWNKYLGESQNLTAIKGAHQARALKYKDKTMKFSMEKRGDVNAKGVPLYIALHGGGGAPSYINDSQWEHMKIYYRDSVNQGVYVAPRGITDTWNLHFVDESYAMYDRLIENMVLYEGVDPNKVYFLGFSAGGDGVYQVVPRMPDRFAAANMSAGHHNWIAFDNLYNTPFLIQVGEYDSAYNRNRVGAENYLKLNELNSQYGGGFIHDLFVHVGGSHNSWRDNDSARGSATVIANAKAWLDSNVRDSKQVNSNAIDWMNQYTRNPLPKRIVWDLATGAQRTYGAGASVLTAEGGNASGTLALQHQLFYWLDVSGNNEYPSNGKLVVNVDNQNNAVNVEEASRVNSFRVLLNTHMLDLAKPVSVNVAGQQVAVVNLVPNLKTMSRTLLERSDKNYIFEAEVALNYNANSHAWEVVRN